MAKRKVVKGQNVMLWMNSKVAALSLSCKLNLSADTEDGGTKDDGFWSAPEITGMKWTMSNESFDSAEKGSTNDQVFADFFDLFIAGEPIDVTMGIPTNQSKEGVPTEGWTAPTPSADAPTYGGKAIITALDHDSTKGSNAKITVSLEGFGALKKVVGA